MKEVVLVGLSLYSAGKKLVTLKNPNFDAGEKLFAFRDQLEGETFDYLQVTQSG